MESNDMYWQQWEKLLEAAANIHQRNPPKLILGNFQGVETGIRQLRRNIPLDTETIDVHGRQLTVPTLPEMIRIKGWMIVCRNAARDYIDFAALVEHVGLTKAAGALDRFDACYLDLIRGREASPMIQLVRQLSEPNPYDIDDIDISQYKGIRTPFSSWDHIRRVCEKMAAELGNRLAE